MAADKHFTTTAARKLWVLIGGTLDEEKPVEVAVMDRHEWRAACRQALDDSGFTYEQLAEMARRNDFESVDARKVWLIVRGTFDEEQSDD